MVYEENNVISQKYTGAITDTLKSKYLMVHVYEEYKAISQKYNDTKKWSQPLSHEDRAL